MTDVNASDTSAQGASAHGGKEIFKAWWQAARPPFYIATLAPLTLGFTFAAKTTGQYRWGLFALILFGSFVVHMATNLANDLFDHIQGVDAGPNIGGSRVIQQGKISPKALTVALVVLYGLGLLSAVIIISLSHQPVLWALVVFAALSSFFYVAPPVKYGHRALGEVFVFINMGLIMTAGTYLAVAAGWDRRVLALALPVSFMVAGILYYQSLPEIETDLAAGKHTLANVLGKTRAAFLYTIWWPVIWLLMINLWMVSLAAWPVFLCLLTLPLHIMAIKKIKAAGDGDWLWLDGHGHLVRKLYLANGVILIVSVAMS
ncbi:1,4-dihydroxy-2-naphthoate prenyltransferase [Deltaproteobacteria bacterium Smac51]|nr:1,4-dihydroxy-2-naphthoate prenyltransferase [Deltaproteobacteria bacterium Smac51]